MSPVEYRNDEIFFHAEVVNATFSDEVTIIYRSDDIQVVKSPSGDDVLIFQHPGSADSNRVIRLYLITSDNDWRRNVTYSWKLSSAWMSSKDEWLFWNVENNIDSQIKVCDSNSLFSSESIQIHVRPLDRVPWSRPSNNELPRTTIYMTNVLIGAHLNGNITDNVLYRPCPAGITSCDIVDGLVVDGPDAMLGSKHGVIWLVLLAILISALVCLYWIAQCVRRAILKSRYEPVAADSDLAMKEEDVVVS